MAEADTQWQRLATITELVRRSPGKLGRTAVMKCLYFLKTMRGMPLDYHFRLYAYGPFDSTVLDDLDYAASLEAVKSSVIYHSGGYAYELEPGPEAEWVRARASRFLAKHDSDIEWVIDEFRGRSAADLELLATLVYVDRVAAEKKERLSVEGLAAKVHEIKPRRSEADIVRNVGFLEANGLLESIRR
jgi:uncharacterized protein YwgA